MLQFDFQTMLLCPTGMPSGSGATRRRKIFFYSRQTGCCKHTCIQQVAGWQSFSIQRVLLAGDVARALCLAVSSDRNQQAPQQLLCH
jgi:hypothetical protein